MALPNTDPSLITEPAPIFTDNSFARGDHLRANNQAIWGNLDYLDTTKALLAGSASQGFSSKYLNLGGNVFIYQDADGSLFLVSNAYTTDGGVTIKLYTTGKRARRLRLEGSDGKGYWDYSQIGTAGDTASWTVAPLIANGTMGGSLEFQTTILPPTVKSGDREAWGVLHHLAADYNMTMADCFQNSWSTFDTYQWYRVVMDSRDGTFKYVHAFDTHSAGTPTFVGSLSDISVTSIVVTSGTAVCNTANTTGLIVANGHVVVVKGSTAGTIVGRITAVVAGVSFSVKTSKADGTYTAGTYSAYYRILTLHGGATSVVSDPDVEKFTPSPLFCSELNGYYLDSAGVPTSSASLAVYRVIGTFINVTQIEYLYSYKSGDKKCDNRLEVTGVPSGNGGCGTINTAILRFSTITYAHGNDYTFTDSVTLGSLVKINKQFNPIVSVYATNSANAIVLGVSVDSTQLSTTASSLTPAIPTIYASIATPYSGITDKAITKGSSEIRAHSSVYISGNTTGFMIVKE